MMFFGALGAAFQRIDPAEAADLLRQYWGLGGRLQRLATEKDDTFRASTPDHRYILKISNPAEREAEIDFQVQILRHLESVDAAIHVPRVLPSLDGRDIVEQVDGHGQKRLLTLLSYIDGTVLSETQSTAAEREKVGVALARLRKAMSTFQHPESGRHLAWDVRNLPELERLLKWIDDEEHRRKLKAGLDRFSRFSAELAAARSQVLHNDFSRSNIVVDHRLDDFVCGIIDFGDSVHTAIAVDVSTALLNQLPPGYDAELFREPRDIVRGYLREADLTGSELQLIPHLVMGRVVGRTLLTEWRARLFPDNAEYILRNTAQGRGQLDWFLERSTSEVSSALGEFL